MLKINSLSSKPDLCPFIDLQEVYLLLQGVVHDKQNEMKQGNCHSKSSLPLHHKHHMSRDYDPFLEYNHQNIIGNVRHTRNDIQSFF